MPVIFDSTRSPTGFVVFDAIRSVPGILTITCNGVRDQVVPTKPVAFKVNQLPTTQGSVELQSSDGSYSLPLTVTTWDAAGGEVIATSARGTFEYGTTDAKLVIKDSSGSLWASQTGIAVEPPGGIIAVSCNGQANTLIPGQPVELTFDGLFDSQGQIELQSADGTYHAILTVTSWDSATNKVVVTGARGELAFGLTDAVLIAEAPDGAQFDSWGGITIKAPADTAWINGDTPSTAENSFFYEALSLPNGSYQLIWRDPNNLNPVVLANGEVDSADKEGTLYVQGYDYADGVTSAEVEFYVRNILAVHPSSALAQASVFARAIARGIVRPTASLVASARAWITRVRLNASGKAPQHRTLVASESYRAEAGIMTFYKQPAEMLDYDIDLEAFLAGTADQVQSFTVEVGRPDELKMDSAYLIFGNRIKVWLSDGVERRNYGVSVKVRTKSGRLVEFDFRLVVRQFD